MGRDTWNSDYGGEGYSSWKPPGPTTRDKIIKVAKIAGAAAAIGAAGYGAVTLGGPLVSPAVDAAGNFIGKACEKIGLVREPTPRSGDWKYEVAKADATPLPPTVLANSTPPPLSTQIPLSEFTRTPTSTSTENTISSQTEYTYEYIMGNKVAFDKDGIPDHVEFASGETLLLDKEFIAKARQEAIDMQEPVIAAQIRLKDSQGFVTSEPLNKKGPEHPVLDELPSDVLTVEELKKRGIEIIQADNTKLWIRPSAFTEDGGFARYKPGAEQKLKIVLIDGGVVSKDFMTNPRYPKEIVDLLYWQSQDMEKYKQDQIRSWEKMLAEYRKKIAIAKAKGDVSKVKDITSGLPTIKTHIFALQNASSSDLILMHSSDGPDAAGYYLSRYDGHTSVIFLAVGKGSSMPKIEIIITPEGEFETHQTESIDTAFDNTPKAGDSFPNPDDFTLNEDASPDNPKSYPYAAQSAGQTLHHEGAHDELYSSHEYRVDMRAMEKIRMAWNKWKNSGFTDNSGYPFVFSLPDGSGYIVTENQEKPANATLLAENIFSPQDLARMRKNINPGRVDGLAKTYIDRTVTSYRFDENGRLIEVGNPTKKFGRA